MIEYRTWEEDDSTVIEARLRATARTYIPNEYIKYHHWVEKVARKQLTSAINNKLYGEITDKLLNLNDKMSKMVYSDLYTRIDIVKEFHKDINEIIHSYEEC